MKDTLPNKMSKLILVALGDLKKAEKSSKYTVAMERWHSPESDGTCHVCLAGSVMAFSLKYPSTDDYYYCKLPRRIHRKLFALDFIRLGMLEDAAGELELTDKQVGKVMDLKEKFDYSLSYSSNPKKFKAYMTNLASKLKKIGL